MGPGRTIDGACQKPDREGGPLSQAITIRKHDASVALTYARASDTDKRVLRFRFTNLKLLNLKLEIGSYA
jgi:hypothetical protein